MPVCPQCDNRPFSNKEALMQHMRSSSAWHPFCTTCDRRFVSQTAYEAHMAAKHPPTYDCTLCNRPYHAPFALEDHYRGSAAHPNCTKCGRGFLDQNACNEHHRTAHPTSACIPCGGKIFYDDELGQHYSISDNHPSCPSCSQGFKDETVYFEHLSTTHPEQHCSMCNANFTTSEALEAHFLRSPVHPKCEQCNIGLASDESLREHVEKDHNPTIEAENGNASASFNVPNSLQQAIEQDEIRRRPPRMQEPEPVYSTGFTPLSPRNLAQTLIIGERQLQTPDILANVGYSSPLIDTQLPPLTPTSLPRPGGKIEELWSSRENKQVPSPRMSYTAPSAPHSLPYSQVYHTQPAATSTSAWSDYTARSALRPRDGHVTLSLQRNLPLSRRSEFDPRLYPGSLRASSYSRLTSSLPESSFGRNGTLDDFIGKSHRSTGSSSISSASSFGRSREAISEPINWRELMAGTNQDASWASSSNTRPSLFSETLTSKGDSFESNSPTPRRLSVQAQNLISSPSLATASISPSSALGHSPGSLNLDGRDLINSTAFFGSDDVSQADTRPTTAESSRAPSFRDVMYTVTPSSECPSPRSPEVSSPIGLKSFPSISPLASTPSDVFSFDIPEARKPLPDSPEALSPATVIVELPSADSELQELSITPQHAPHSPLSTSSTQTYITSPQEPSDLRIHTDDLEPRADESEPAMSTENPGSGNQSPAVLHSAGLLTSAPATPIAPTSPKTTNPNPLHCRQCLSDSCDDITATMCGHIFCNRCIVDAVIKTSRCPVCMTPTLLYCLFRLDIAA